MKKQLLVLGALLTLGANAQNKITFEDLTLAPNSYYTGADGAGQFVSGGVTFPNLYYAPPYEGWSKFTYSNSKNDSTAGSGNSHSAITAIGASGSNNYAVNNYGSELNFGKTVAIQSIDLTNTTYAYLSMKNGDEFAKKFGTLNSAGPNGTPDGTNGADFFNVIVIGYNTAGVKTDSVVVDLADFRFTDNTKDYILNTWKTVDLSKLGLVRSIGFKYQSSDVGSFGMNTPAYVAIDNIAYGFASLSSLSTSTIEAFPNPFENTLSFGNVAGDLTVVDVTGKVIFSNDLTANEAVNTTEWLSGVYIATIVSEGTVYRATVVKK